MPATLDPVQKQREILTAFRRVTLQRAQTETSAAAHLTADTEAAEAALQAAHEQEEAQIEESERLALAERNGQYDAAEARYADQLREGETGVEIAQKHFEGARTILGLADQRHLLDDARTVPVRLQPGQDPAQELRRCVKDTADTAATIDRAVDRYMAERTKTPERRLTMPQHRRLLPLALVGILFVLFVGYSQSRPCSLARGLLSAGAASCPATLTGHSGAVNAVAYSPDGGTIASGSSDGTVRLWNLARHSSTRVLHGHSEGVASVAFSPDGKLLASASADTTTKLWDAATGRELRTLAGSAAPALAVAVAPDGNSVATGSADGSVRVWSVTGAALQTLAAGPGAVRAVAFSADGKALASAGDDGAVQLWDPATGAQLRSLSAGAGTLFAVAFSPDDALLATTGSDGAVRMWHPASGEQVRSLPVSAGAVRGLAFSADGKRLVSASDDKRARVWDVASGTLLHNDTTGDKLQAVAFAPNGVTIALATDGGAVLLKPSR